MSAAENEALPEPEPEVEPETDESTIPKKFDFSEFSDDRLLTFYGQSISTVAIVFATGKPAAISGAGEEDLPEMRREIMRRLRKAHKPVGWSDVALMIGIFFGVLAGWLAGKVQVTFP